MSLIDFYNPLIWWAVMIVTIAIVNFFVQKHLDSVERFLYGEEKNACIDQKIETGNQSKNERYKNGSTITSRTQI